MKSITYFAIFTSILLSLPFMGCEDRADGVKLQPRDNVKIITRSCPNGGDCACSITYKNAATSNAEILVTICGTTDGDATTCTEPDPPVTCEIIDGLSHSEITLDIDYARHLFCMESEHGIRIDVINVMSTVPDTLIISCQEGVLNPDTTMLIVHPTGGRFYIQTTTECEVPPCI